MAWTYKLAGWDLGLALGNERGRSPICAVGDHCETKTLKFAGLLMSID